MEIRWSLNALYPGLNSEEFQNDKKRFNDNIGRLTEYSFSDNDDQVKAAEKFVTLLKRHYKLSLKMLAFLRLSVSVDAQNEPALKMSEILEKEMVKITKKMVEFQTWLSKIKDRNRLYQNSDLLKEHKFLIEEMVEKSEYLLSEDEEELIAQMKQTGSSAWTKLQEKLTSTLKVPIEIEGEKKELPLPVVRNMAYKKDPEIRRKAYQAELKTYQEIDESVAAALNGIKGEVLTLTERRGYNSPLEEALKESRLKKETLDALLA